MLAVINGRLDSVQYLVGERAANVEAKTAKGHTALMLATINSRLDIVQYLAGERAANIW